MMALLRDRKRFIKWIETPYPPAPQIFIAEIKRTPTFSSKEFIQDQRFEKLEFLLKEVHIEENYAEYEET